MNRRTFLKLLGATVARLALPFKTEPKQELVVGVGHKSPQIIDNWGLDNYDPISDIEQATKECLENVGLLFNYPLHICNWTLTQENRTMKWWSEDDECLLPIYRQHWYVDVRLSWLPKVNTVYYCYFCTGEIIVFSGYARVTWIQRQSDEPDCQAVLAGLGQLTEWPNR